MYRRIISKSNLFTVFFFFLCSFVTVQSGNVRKYGLFSWNTMTMIKILFGMGIFVFAEKIYSKIVDSSINITPLQKFRLFQWNRMSFWKSAFLFFLFLIPYFIIFYPGISHWDTMYQIKDFYDGYTVFNYTEGGRENVFALLNDHHPVFDTLIFAVFIQIGNLCRNVYVGLVAYSLFQILTASVIFSLMLCFLDKMGSNDVIKLSSFLILILPFIGIYEVTMLKDVIYGNIFVLYMINYIYLVKIKEGGKNFVYLFILAILLSLTKKTGVYLVMLSLIPLLFVLRNKRKVLTSIIASGFLMFVLLPRIVFPLFSIFPGGKQEMYGTLFQQTALLVIEKEDDLSEEDKKIIDKVLKYDQLKEKYSAEYTQEVKALYRWDCEISDFVNYLKVWFKYGIKYPSIYARATLSTCGGFFSPANGHIEVYSTLAVMGADSYEGMQDYEPFTELRQRFIEFYYCLTDVQWNYFFYLFTYIWIIPSLVLHKMILNHQRKAVCCLCPVLISIVVLILCPLSKSRYAFSQILVCPLILALGRDETSFYETDSRRDIKNEPQNIIEHHTLL